MGLFKEIRVLDLPACTICEEDHNNDYNTITKKGSQIMGNTFDSTMPEEHYQSEISDLKCQLDHAESLLIKAMIHIPIYTKIGKKVKKYIDKLETVHN